MTRVFLSTFAVNGARQRQLIERDSMVSPHTKIALAGAWIMTVGLIGVLGNVTSIAAGALVLGCGLVPPLLASRQIRIRSTCARPATTPESRPALSTILAGATPS